MTDSTPLIAEDSRRFPVCRNGQLVYSSPIDNGKVMCLQRCCRCALFASDVVAQRTFVDIYTNAVVVNSAWSFCCCMFCDNVRTLYFDRPPFTDPVTPAACCNPFPHPCLHCFGLCGEGLVFKGGIHGCPELGFGHLFGWVGMCFFPFNIVYGLPPGEAHKTCAIINKQVAEFRTSGGQFLEAARSTYGKVMT